MAVSLTSNHTVTVSVIDTQRNNLVIANADSQSFAEEDATKTTGRVVDEVPVDVGVGDYTINIGGITTISSVYLKMTDDTKAAITVKLTSAGHADQVIQGRQFSIQDCSFTAIKVVKDAAVAKPIEYILVGV